MGEILSGLKDRKTIAAAFVALAISAAYRYAMGKNLGV